jgi:cellulose synthase/poly-beta-1,6-N-acetylglucosamine synthase-like glycosyltransferase
MTISIFLKTLWILCFVHIFITWISAILRGRNARTRKFQKNIKAAELSPVSIIVPAWNESERINRCINALKLVEYPNYEVLVLAGGEDGTYPIAESTIQGDDRFRLLPRGLEPKNAALNQGIAQAQHEVLVLLDADNIVEPGWLRALVVPLYHGAAATVGESFPNLWTWVTRERQMWHLHTYEVLQLPLIQGDRSVAVKRDALEAVGGLPTHTYAREDWDLGVRLEKQGYTIGYSKGARLVTDWPSTLKELWQLQVRWRRTHLAGLWEQRAFFAKKWQDGFRQLYFYLLTVGVALYLLVGATLALFIPPWRAFFFQSLLVLLAWLVLRPPALSAEIAAYTGDPAWLKHAWPTAPSCWLKWARRW